MVSGHYDEWVYRKVKIPGTKKTIYLSFYRERWGNESWNYWRVSQIDASAFDNGFLTMSKMKKEDYSDDSARETIGLRAFIRSDEFVPASAKLTSEPQWADSSRRVFELRLADTADFFVKYSVFDNEINQRKRVESACKDLPPPKFVAGIEKSIARAIAKSKAVDAANAKRKKVHSTKVTSNKAAPARPKAETAR